MYESAERNDLQRLLRSQIDVLGDELYVLTEEFGEWEDSRRRIDLLAIDPQANLVVIELKRTNDGGHMVAFSRLRKCQLHIIEGATSRADQPKRNHTCFRIASLQEFIIRLTKAGIAYEDLQGTPGRHYTPGPMPIQQISFETRTPGSERNGKGVAVGRRVLPLCGTACPAGKRLPLRRRLGVAFGCRAMRNCGHRTITPCSRC